MSCLEVRKVLHTVEEVLRKELLQLGELLGESPLLALARAIDSHLRNRVTIWGDKKMDL